MDCGNFCLSWILENINKKSGESDFIFSEIFPGVGLLPKIWIILLEHLSNIEIIHEKEEVFVNLKNEEFPLLEEYNHRLDEFTKLWWKYFNNEITIPYLKEKLKDNYCIIPIKKGEGSHFVVLQSINENEVNLVDNKKWEFSVTIDAFENLINLKNWKYVLFSGR